jgi:hypothetical protein
MWFVQSLFLLAGLAVAIPIIIHLVFRQRAKRIDLGTLRFLRIVLEQNARRRRVMRWLLLCLRLACVALLAFLFARPYLLASRPMGEKQTTVVLIDRSATMELKQSDGLRAIERAIADVKALLVQASDNTRFEIAFFDHAVHPLFPPAPADQKSRGKTRPPSKSELLAKLKVPAECYGATDFGAALEWARDVLAKAPDGPRKLHIFTDFQQSGLAWSEVDELPPEVTTTLHDLGRSAVNNVAVTEARAQRAWLRPDEQTAVHVTVYNGGPFTTAELPVMLRLKSEEQKVELKEQLKVEPGTSESVRFDLPPLAAGLWQGDVTVELEDDLPLDNKRPLALLASPPYQVLLIDGRQATSPVLAATYFLETAMRLAPEGELYAASPFEPKSIAAGDRLPNLEKLDVVVLSDVGDVDRRDANEIAALVKRGGGLLVFGGENVTAERTQALADAGLTVGKIGGIHHSVDLPLRLGSWDRKHPIFEPFSDPQLGDLQRLSFSACTKIEPAKDAQVLARFRDGTPAVIERKVGKGTVVWFTSTSDRRWSDWTRSRLYLPLVYQLLGHQSGLTAGGRVRSAVLESGSAPPEDIAPGIHAREGHTLVVTTSPREAETDRSSTEEFVNRFGLKIGAEAAPTEVAATPQAPVGDELIDSEFWPILASILLGTLLLEGLVANRTAA